MHVYQLSPREDAKSRYFGTLQEAHNEARPYMMYADRQDLRIYLLDLPSDKAALIGYLNHGDEDLGGELLRAWALTARGGLVERPGEVTEIRARSKEEATT